MFNRRPASRLIATALGLGLVTSAAIALSAAAQDTSPPSAPIPYGKLDAYLKAAPKDRVAQGWVFSPAVPAISPALAAAVASSDRTAAMKARDGGRRPAEVFAYAGLKPGDRVIELGSFGRYDSTIITNTIGATGHLYMYDLPYQQARNEAPTKEFNTAHPNSEYKIGRFDQLTYPSNIDLVVIDMYYHDLEIATTGQVNTAALLAKLKAALKPGGRVLIVDHNAAPGSGRRDIGTIHRIDPEVIKREMSAAGFRLAVDSNMFRTSTDDHTKMVFDPTERGATDRSLFVFEKPRR